LSIGDDVRNEFRFAVGKLRNDLTHGIGTLFKDSVLEYSVRGCSRAYEQVLKLQLRWVL
jgi:hypothetical protein